MDKRLEKATVTKIHGAFTVHQRSGAKVTMNGRRSFALSLSTGGIITYTHKGKKYVSDKTHAIIHPMGSHYSFVCEREGDFPVIDFYTTHIFTEDFLVFELGDPEFILKKFSELKETLLSGRGRHRALSIFYEILSAITDKSVTDAGILTDAVKYIHEHYSDKSLTSSTLAGKAHVCESYFRRSFKNIYGETPKQYVKALRIKRACQLLCEGSLSVTEISEQCGFSSVYHFCRAFKQSIGSTPTEYYKRALKGEL